MTSVAEEILTVPLEERVKFLRSDKGLHARLTEVTGTAFHVWSDAPCEFVRDVLGETTWSGQRQILQSVQDHERTAVVASHSVGKSHTAARIAVWWIATRPIGAAQVVTTAPTWRQVRTILWPHIRRLHRSAGLPGRIGLAPEWWVGSEVVAFGFSPSEHDEAAAQGIHAAYPMVLVDEAGGISRSRYQGLEAVLSGGIGRMLAIGNAPTDDENSAFEERYYSPGWNGIRLSAWQTPNLSDPPEETPPCACVVAKWRPHLIAEHLTTREWVEDVRADYGEDSAYWIARVDAQFPHGTTSKAIPVSWVEAAQERDMPGEVGGVVALGVDVAADGGDELAFAVARGFDVTFLEGRAGADNADPLKVAHRIRQHIEGGEDVGWEGLIAAQRRLDPNRRGVVKIDAIGLGWGVAGIVKAWASEMMWPVMVVPVQVGERPNSLEGQKRYANKRAEMWWTGRELIRDTVRLTCDKRCAAQLSGPTYSSTSAGKILIESKDSLRSKGLPSPDRAEAVLLAMYQEVNAQPASTSGLRTVEARIPGVTQRHQPRQEPRGPWGNRTS